MLIFAALTALGLLQATAADGLPAPAAPAPKLSDIPGVTISYYDAVGQSIPDLHAWLEKHGPRDALAHKITPATSGWSSEARSNLRRRAGNARSRALP